MYLEKYVIIFHHGRISQFFCGKYLSFPGCVLCRIFSLSVPSASGVLKPKLGLAPTTGNTTLSERSSCLIDLWSTHCLSKCPPPSYSSAEQVQCRGKTNNKHFCAYPVHSSYSIVALTQLFGYAKLEREWGRLEKEPCECCVWELQAE